MYRQKFEYEFGPMIFLWRLKFQRDFVLNFFVKNAFLLLKNEPEKKYFLVISALREAFYQNTYLLSLIYSSNLFSKCKNIVRFESTSQGLFKYGVICRTQEGPAM